MDTFGNAYVTGMTGSTNFPMVHPFQVASGEDVGSPFFGDAFVAKLNAAGNTLIRPLAYHGSS